MKKRNLGTELCLAVFRGEPDTVHQLITDGADIDCIGDGLIPSVAGSTPLWLAANLAGQEQSATWASFCQSLSEVFPEIPPRDRATKRAQFLRIVNLLIDAGADLEKPAHGTVPLRVSVYRRDIELAQLLLSRGANPNAESLSVLSRLAKRQGRRTLPAYYNTVLHEAVEKESAAIVDLLLAAGADPTHTDHEGRTPMDIARERGRTDIMELLRQGRAKNA